MNADLKSSLLAGLKKKEITLYNGKKVVIRPMLFKEIKMIAVGQEENKDELEIASNVIKSCVIEGKVDVNKLTMFDFEKLNFEIWKLARSTPNISVPFVCKNEIDGNECGADFKVDSNLNTVSLSREPESLIKLNDTVTVKMRYPNMTELSFFDIESPTDLFDLAWRLVEEVHFNGQIMKVGMDMKAEDLLELNEYIPSEGIQKMFQFINNMPTHVMDVAVKCPKCGHYEAVRMSGTQEICFE